MDLLHQTINYLQNGIATRDTTVISILIAVIVVLLSIVFVLLRGGSNKRRGVLLLGLCDSGKTLLFTRLVNGSYVETHTSIQQNSSTYKLSGDKKGTLRIIDLPGHERLRARFLEQYKSLARGIIFVIDSLTFQKDLRDVAEYLYWLLTDRVISQNAPPILIACNKHDQPLAKGARNIQAQLEKEMNTLRVTQSAALKATGTTGNNNTYLGKRNKDFELADLHPIKVRLVECNARGNKDTEEHDLERVTDWLSSIA